LLCTRANKIKNMVGLPIEGISFGSPALVKPTGLFSFPAGRKPEFTPLAFCPYLRLYFLLLQIDLPQESPVTQRMRPLGGFSGQIPNYYGVVRWVHLHPAWPAAVDCRSGYLKLSYFVSRHSTAAAIRWSVRNPTYQEAPAAAATNSRYTAASGYKADRQNQLGTYATGSVFLPSDSTGGASLS